MSWQTEELKKLVILTPQNIPPCTCTCMCVVVDKENKVPKSTRTRREAGETVAPPRRVVVDKENRVPKSTRTGRETRGTVAPPRPQHHIHVTLGLIYINKPRNHHHRGMTIVPIFISTGPIVTRWEDGNDRHTKTPSSHKTPIVTGEPPGKGCADLWT